MEVFTVTLTVVLALAHGGTRLVHQHTALS